MRHDKRIINPTIDMRMLARSDLDPAAEPPAAGAPLEGAPPAPAPQPAAVAVGQPSPAPVPEGEPIGVLPAWDWRAHLGAAEEGARKVTPALEGLELAREIARIFNLDAEAQRIRIIRAVAVERLDPPHVNEISAAADEVARRCGGKPNVLTRCVIYDMLYRHLVIRFDMPDGRDDVTRDNAGI